MLANWEGCPGSAEAAAARIATGGMGASVPINLLMHIFSWEILRVSWLIINRFIP